MRERTQDAAVRPEDISEQLIPLVCLSLMLWRMGFDAVIDDSHVGHPSIILRDGRGGQLPLCFEAYGALVPDWSRVVENGIDVSAWESALEDAEKDPRFELLWKHVRDTVYTTRFPLPAAFYAESGMLFGGPMPKAKA